MCFAGEIDVTEQRRKAATWSHLQAAQWVASDCTDRKPRSHPNRATLQVARKLVAYLLAVDESGQPFRDLRAG